MKTKKCSKCDNRQPVGEFSLKDSKTGRRDTQCKVCKRKYIKSHYEANKKAYKKRAIEFNKRRAVDYCRKMVEYLADHPCVDCGEDDVVVLQFDHLSDKRMCVTRMVRRGYAWGTIAEEIAKCEVRCANCHTRKTAKDFGWKWKSRAG